ncbi:uncharacterized protein LOC142363101 isoform X2 [Opisthocomus hoazin]|uniref:uncharacterized protein LOC142363101 isoform X2 n=1 Tax=Opisthocomus hoazin TaxID=30419 RepID=UPI003F53CBA0
MLAGRLTQPRAGGVVTARPRAPAPAARLAPAPRDVPRPAPLRPRLPPAAPRFDAAPRFPVSITWRFHGSSDVLVTGTLLNCSLGAGGAPSSCFAKCFSNAYRGRAQLFPENGSLLLQDLQLNDSRVYAVTFSPPPRTWTVTLTVHEQRFTPRRPDTAEPNHTRYYVIGICSSVSILLLLLLFCCIRHRGAALQKRRRIIRQQRVQISSTEESPMENFVVRNMETIYARVGDTFEQPQPKPTPEATYASVSSPGPRGRDTGPYHLLM